MSHNLIARIAVAVVAIPAILWIGYQGGYWLLGMIALFGLIGMIEFLRGEGYTPGHRGFWLMLLFVALWFGLFFLIPFEFAPEATGMGLVYLPAILLAHLLALFVFTGVSLSVGKETPAELMQRATRLYWGAMYICLLYPCVLLVAHLPESGFMSDGPAAFSGGDLLLFLFGLLWLGDTAAMGVGHWLGKRKLAPTVSPNKTVEGFIGGILGAIVVGLIMYFWKLNALGITHVILLAIGCSVFGQLGDLVESMWKRSVGVKDSSTIIPGHGGVLDRFDSLLFAAPFMVGYVTIVHLVTA